MRRPDSKVSRTLNDGGAFYAEPPRVDTDTGWRGTPLFAVEIRLIESTEEALTTPITVIQRWLDNSGLEPPTFRYTFFDAGILLRVDFNLQSEAVAFAKEFSGLGAYFGEITPAYDRTGKLNAAFTSPQQ